MSKLKPLTILIFTLLIFALVVCGVPSLARAAPKPPPSVPKPPPSVPKPPPSVPKPPPSVPKPPPSVNEIAQGPWRARFSAASGIALWYNGVPVTRRSSLYIVKPGWTGLIYDARTGKPSVTTENLSLTATDENADVKIAYRITLDADNSATTELTYALKHDLPGEIEYAAGFVNGSMLADAPYTAQTAAGPCSGVVPYTPPVSDPENNRFVPSFQAITFDTRLGSLKISVAGDWPDFVCFDARHISESWAQEAPIFWIGLGVTPHALQYANGKTFHIITRYQFDSASLHPLDSTNVDPLDSSSPAAWVPQAARTHLKFMAADHDDARVPQPLRPVVIPQPKVMSLGKPRLRLNAKTRLVIADGATAQDREAALTVQRELAVRFGLADLPIVRAAAVHQPENILVFGEPKRMPLIAALLHRLEASQSTKAEGYALRVTPAMAVVAGRDPAGTFYGAQTLCQLFGLDANGPFVWAASIDDYPALPWRGAHLFVGDQALPFHKKLIQNIFSRIKMNNIVLQCEQAKWQTTGKSAPSWGMSKDDLCRENAFARQHFLAVTPLINSVGHMEWLFSDPDRTPLAEDPATPYAVNTADPAADKFLFQLYDEVIGLFHPKYLHIGADEVTLRGRYPYRSRAIYPTVAAEFNAQVTKAYVHLKGRGVGTMIWGDMLLADGEAPDATSAPSAAQGAQMRAALPHDIVIADWHYVPEGDFSSPSLFRKAGFTSVIGATWSNPKNIAAFSRSQAASHQAGLLQTTWAGYNSSEHNLTDDPQQFAAFVLAGDYAWTGASTPPDRLPYNPAHIFSTWYAPARIDPRTRRGFTVDLSPAGDRSLVDTPARGGWLGYGPSHDLRQLPTGIRRLSGILYTLPSRIVLLRGGLNPAGGPYPSGVTISIQQRAATLSLLLSTAYAALPQTQIGTLSVLFADGTRSVIPLIYGRNLAAWNDSNDARESPVIWSGRTVAGEATLLRALTWNNPAPSKVIASLTLTANDSGVSPILYAVTGLK